MIFLAWHFQTQSLGWRTVRCSPRLSEQVRGGAVDDLDLQDRPHGQLPCTTTGL